MVLLMLVNWVVTHFLGKKNFNVLTTQIRNRFTDRLFQGWGGTSREPVLDRPRTNRTNQEQG